MPFWPMRERDAFSSLTLASHSGAGRDDEGAEGCRGRGDPKLIKPMAEGFSR